MGSNGPFMGRAMMSAEAAPVCFFFLPSSFRHTFTRHQRQQMKTFKIYRYDPDSNKEPELQEYKLDLNEYVSKFINFYESQFHSDSRSSIFEEPDPWYWMH